MPRAIRKETVAFCPMDSPVPLYPGRSKPREIELAIRLVEGMSLHWDPKLLDDEEDDSAGKIVNFSDYLRHAARRNP